MTEQDWVPRAARGPSHSMRAVWVVELRRTLDSPEVLRTEKVLSASASGAVARALAVNPGMDLVATSVTIQTVVK